MNPVLTVDNLYAYYGRVQVLHGISFRLHSGKVTALLGSNGAGKTTTLRAISGMVRRLGAINLEGNDITRASIDKTARLGVAHVLQDRGTLAELTVEENLLAGGLRNPGRAKSYEQLDKVYTMFPRLRERYVQPGGSLSGGEQQMLAIGRALMMQPKLLLLDEPSLGLSPQMLNTVFQRLEEINSSLGTTMMIVEQNAEYTLNIAQYAYVLEAGEIAVEGPSRDLQNDERVRDAFLGS